MNTREIREIPVSLKALRQRFEDWRNTRIARQRIPDALWADAVKAADVCGLHRTANVLRVNYYTLKKLLENSRMVQGRRSASATTFVELPPAASMGACDCTLELEDTDGSKMRVQLKASVADVTALCRSLWK